jgi:hypothetical protein
MKIKFATTLLMIGTMLGPVAALAADPDSDRSSPKVFVKDSAITTEIKTKLAAEHITSLGRDRPSWLLHRTWYANPLRLLRVATRSMKSSAVLTRLVPDRALYLSRRWALAAFASYDHPLR